MKKTGLVLLTALTAGGAANAVTLDFGELAGGVPVICADAATPAGSFIACREGAYISQDYGDVAGVLDITYSAPRYADGRGLHWWSAGYNVLWGVLYADGDGGPISSKARIDFRPVDPGAVVNIQSFELGVYPNMTLPTTVSIRSLLTDELLFSFSGDVGNIDGLNQPTRFTPALTVVGGVRLEWEDGAFQVGLDHLNYAVTGVPEPAQAGLLVAGLAALAGLARRRRSARV